MAAAADLNLVHREEVTARDKFIDFKKLSYEQGQCPCSYDMTKLLMETCYLNPSTNSLKTCLLKAI